MLFLSDRLTSASGSIGGSTFSHNRFGMYIRARRKPVNPNTAAQQSQRDAFASSSAAWRSLTDNQRAGWEAYAAASPAVNALGQAVHLTGQQHFTASNSMSLRLGGTALTDAPTVPGKYAIGTPNVVLDASALTAAVTLLEPPDDVTVGLFLGSPQSAGISFFAGPYQLRGVGDIATNAITFTAVKARNALAMVAGMRIPYRLAGIDWNSGSAPNKGRLTTVASGIVTVVA